MESFKLPSRLIVEKNAFGRVDKVMNATIPGIENKKVIIVTEEALQKIFVKPLQEMCTDFKNSEVYLVSKNSFDQAVALAKYICMNDIQVVLGLGGGSVLDVAKYAAFVSKTTYLCLPTTLSNDSLASPVAVLGTEGDNRKTFGCTIPTGIIVDTDVIMNAPVLQLKSGIGDTISKYTALYDWQLDCKKNGTIMNDFAYMIANMALDSIFYNIEKSLTSAEFIRILVQSLVLGGLAMEISRNSRPCSGSEHLFCHSLEENYQNIPVPHGIAVAMGSIPACIFQKRDTEKLLKIIAAYDIDINPKNWNITKEIFIDAWQRASATRTDRYTILNDADLSAKRLAQIYDMMCQY